MRTLSANVDFSHSYNFVTGERTIPVPPETGFDHGHLSQRDHWRGGFSMARVDGAIAYNVTLARATICFPASRPCEHGSCTRKVTRCLRTTIYSTPASAR